MSATPFPIWTRWPGLRLSGQETATSDQGQRLRVSDLAIITWALMLAYVNINPVLKSAVCFFFQREKQTYHQVSGMNAVTRSEKLAPETWLPKKEALRVGPRRQEGAGCGHCSSRGSDGMRLSKFASQEDPCTWRQMGKFND